MRRTPVGTRPAVCPSFSILLPEFISCFFHLSPVSALPTRGVCSSGLERCRGFSISSSPFLSLSVLLGREACTTEVWFGSRASNMAYQRGDTDGSLQLIKRFPAYCRGRLLGYARWATLFIRSSKPAAATRFSQRRMRRGPPRSRWLRSAGGELTTHLCLHCRPLSRGIQLRFCLWPRPTTMPRCVVTDSPLALSRPSPLSRELALAF